MAEGWPHAVVMSRSASLLCVCLFECTLEAIHSAWWTRPVPLKLPLASELRAGLPVSAGESEPFACRHRGRSMLLTTARFSSFSISHSPLTPLSAIAIELNCHPPPFLQHHHHHRHARLVPNCAAPGGCQAPLCQELRPRRLGLVAGPPGSARKSPSHGVAELPTGCHCRFCCTDRLYVGCKWKLRLP